MANVEVDLRIKGYASQLQAQGLTTAQIDLRIRGAQIDLRVGRQPPQLTPRMQAWKKSCQNRLVLQQKEQHYREQREKEERDGRDARLRLQRQRADEQAWIDARRREENAERARLRALWKAEEEAKEAAKRQAKFAKLKERAEKARLKRLNMTAEERRIRAARKKAAKGRAIRKHLNRARNEITRLDKQIAGIKSNQWLAEHGGADLKNKLLKWYSDKRQQEIVGPQFSKEDQTLQKHLHNNHVEICSAYRQELTAERIKLEKLRAEQPPPAPRNPYNRVIHLDFGDAREISGRGTSHSFLKAVGRGRGYWQDGTNPGWENAVRSFEDNR